MVLCTCWSSPIYEKKDRKIHRLTGDAFSIYEAQGQLCLCTANTLNRYEFSIWILEDYGASKWTLKHKLTMLKLFGLNNIRLGFEAANADYRIIVVHLE